mgnify:CR=1 FL=1
MEHLIGLTKAHLDGPGTQLKLMKTEEQVEEESDEARGARADQHVGHAAVWVVRRQAVRHGTPLRQRRQHRYLVGWCRCDREEQRGQGSVQTCADKGVTGTVVHEGVRKRSGHTTATAKVQTLYRLAAS